ncbi:MAG: type II toxin-antitoxin system VapC family toxin [Nitrospira sp.]|jgi:predicted nucleic acid-binding protein|nr:MAG: type II toxin-antitoxin system VapC family toxin [Nitrospira sp.]
MIIVPDASVILKWVLEQEHEPDHRKAIQLQQALLDESIEIRLPTLWRYEVGNVLGLKKPAMAVELMSALLAYEFDEVPLRTEYGLAVLEHMREVKHVTFYDSAYHVLAIRTKGLYLTADTAYVKRAKAKGHVVLLAEWKAPAT